MAKLRELSIFFPFWNEEENIENVVKSAIPVAREVADKWEMVLVDDGSSDSTLLKAQNLAKRYENIKVASHTPNRGYGAALKEGFSNSSYEYVVFTDGDGQFDFSQVVKFIEKVKDNDIVIGFRSRRRDNIIRHILMNLLKVWDFIFFGFRFRDIDCGFKMFTRQAIQKIMPLRSEGAMISTEILAKANRKKLKIAQVEVTHLSRKYGDQSGGNIPVVVRAVLESLMLWLDLRSGRF